ncbi:MAG: class I SAM-dependent methyltransferase [SAR324 cluster bacterium]|nr:class I SAM-dependent methyltransferase [SAR324 cluster bacterium]
MLTVDFERLRLQAGMTALDAGCGQGRHSLELLRRGCPAVAMDLNPADLAHTRYVVAALVRELREAGGAPPLDAGRKLGFLAMRGDTLNLPFASGRFDRVICSEVLEHVADPARAARELARVLKPGGVIAVSVPTPITEWVYRYSSDDYFRTPGGHVRIFAPRDLAALLADQGLRVIDVNFEHAFHSIYWWARCVFGLHNEAHPVIRHCKKILTYTMFSPRLARAERFFNHIVPKSMVLYASKDAANSPRVELRPPADS